MCDGVAVKSERLSVEDKFWSTSDLTGDAYDLVLDRFHKLLKPKSYLEIGTLNGVTLELANSASIAVDPAFKISRPLIENKPELHLYQETSDEFFSKHSPSAILGRPIDLAFLDGMHLFEYVLRDFINVEKHCKNNSIICVHDCVPVDAYVGRRDCSDFRWKTASRHPEWWAGDVWKAAIILAKYRSDLKIRAFNAHPTGLLAITNLNPLSSILSERYFDFVDEYRDISLFSAGESYVSSLNMIDASETSSLESLSRLFWL